MHTIKNNNPMNYNRFIKIVSICFGILVFSNSYSQNLRWSFSVESTGASTSAVKVFVQNVSMTTPENITSFATYFYYENPLSTATSFDVTPTTANLWPNNGISSSNLVNEGMNGSVTIPHNRFASINLSDVRVGTPGVDIPANSLPIHVLTINFSNQNPASLGWLTQSLEQPGLVYSNNNFDEFDIIVTGPQFAPLPITLKSFDAIKHSASSAKLDWTTSKEVNSDYFGIERSIDGSTWDEIARVKAAGDSNVDIAYDYIDDRLPLSRTNGQVFYYRLRLTDLDGAFKYSDVRGVNFDKQALGPISIYPNPTTEIVNIDLSEVVMEDGDVYVSVYDMSGRLVMTKQIIGSGIELIKVDQLPSDAYNFIIRQGEQIHQQRVIKID